MKAPKRYFFCKILQEFGEIGECGKFCDLYEPRNKKSGCCESYSLKNYSPDKQVKL